MRLAPSGAFTATVERRSRCGRFAVWVRHMCGFVLILALAACGSTQARPTVVPTATEFSVTIATDFSAYNSSQAVGVTVRNGGAHIYYATDDHSECTIVQLQERVNDTWVNVMPCTTGQQPIVLEVAPGAGVP